MSGSPLIIGASTEALGAITTLELLKITCSTALAAPSHLSVSHLILPPRARSRQRISSHLDHRGSRQQSAYLIASQHHHISAYHISAYRISSYHAGQGVFCAAHLILSTWQVMSNSTHRISSCSQSMSSLSPQIVVASVASHLCRNTSHVVASQVCLHWVRRCV